MSKKQDKPEQAGRGGSTVLSEVNADVRRWSDDEISDIVDRLHSKMQFYDQKGRAANGDILDEVEMILRTKKQST